eukprot:TRINITY_DN4584_c0_g1_i1.p1 TRINITY_DN4584_c0_g1~~TRINITY_DN4584_c0_g1_i1.p1  ORF type:complete len:180 (-),score=19.87 TRINITY_DN4584_c0_g1_i1:17-556(-)
MTSLFRTSPLHLFQLARARPNRADRALFGKKSLLYGNRVSWAANKSRRRWLPNIQKKTYRSDLLGVTFRIPLTTYVMRCIDKWGSLDYYLLYTKDNDIDSQVGLDIRQMLLERYKEVNGVPFKRSEMRFKMRLERLAKSQMVKDNEINLKKKRMSVAANAGATSAAGKKVKKKVKKPKK